MTRVLLEEAPGALLNAVRLETAALIEAMESGEVDLTLGYFPALQDAGLHQQHLSMSDFVCIARDGNPFVRDRLTLARYLAAPHVAIRAAGQSQELLEKALDMAGHRRSVRVKGPSYLALLELVPKTDLIATVPQRLADLASRIADVRVHRLPLPSPRFPLQQFWRRRFQTDPASQWLRALVNRLASREWAVEPNAAAETMSLSP